MASKGASAVGLAATKYMGKKAGKRGEVTMFYRVRPGHEEAIRKEIEAFYSNPNRTNADDPRVGAGLAQIGARYETCVV